MGYDPDPNLYAYVHEDPANKTDPTGNRERILIDSATHNITVMVLYQASGSVSSSTVGGTTWHVTVVPVNGSLIDNSGQTYRNQITGEPGGAAGNGDTDRSTVGAPGGTTGAVGTLTGQMADMATGDDISKTVAHELVGHGGGLGDAYNTSTGQPNSSMNGNLMNNDSNGTKLTGGQLNQMTSPSSGSEIVNKGGSNYQ